MSSARAIIIGKKFQKARQQLGLSQQSVADKAGLYVSHYAKIERGERKGEFETLEKIIKALKMSLKDLE
jgi:transcriptional regulator with XRE-family HTH domain